MNVAIIDNGLSNLGSIYRALQECGASPFIVEEPSTLSNASRIVLPGVGSFGRAMDSLKQSGMDQELHEYVKAREIPFLGICLGMHLIAKEGNEGNVDGVSGLAWVNSYVRRLESPSHSERIPHVGWNGVEHKSDNALFDGIESGTDFYFVHSYHMDCVDENLPIAVTPCCGQFVSVVAKNNIVGVQFHPEKSQKAGFALLKNFLAI